MGDLLAIAAGVDHDVARSKLLARVDQRSATRGRHGEVGRTALGDRRGRREHVRDPADRSGQRLPDRRDQSGRERACSFHRHLLTEHSSGQQLDTIGVSGRAEARSLPNERCQDRVVGEVRLDRIGIGVEVEHSAASLHGRLRVGDIVEMQRTHQRVRARRARTRRHGDHRVAVAQPERPVIGRAIPRLDPGHGTHAEKVEDALGVEAERDTADATRGCHPSYWAADSRAGRRATTRTPRGSCR